MKLCGYAFIAAIALGMGLTASAGIAGAEESAKAASLFSAPIAIDLPAQPMERALAELSQRTGLGMIFSSEAVAMGLQAPAIRGTYAPEAALQLLLASSGLTYEFINARTVAIRSVKPIGAQKTSLWDRSRLAQVGQGTNSPSSAIGINTTDSQEQLQEVVVTAQKREERLQDVPVPVTAVSGEALIAGNMLQIQDYYTQVPGLNFSVGNRGEPMTSIRGIESYYGNPTVGVVIDDIPFGSATVYGGGYNTPDLDPSDLARVEVLRGPQGTLYGASSMGGLIKYVTVDPSTQKYDGLIQVGTSNVRNGEQQGYSLRGAINIPVANTLGIRASAFKRLSPGYIENVTTQQRGVNSDGAYGGRLAALWRPADDTSLRLSALFQENTRHGSPYIYREPDLGDLEQRALEGTGWLERKNTALSATFETKIGKANLVSITGYNINQFATSLDLTALLGSAAESFFSVPGVATAEKLKNKRFSEDLRLTTPLGEHFEWLIGGFFTHESTDWHQNLVAIDPVTLSSPGDLLISSRPNSYEEYAAYTDVTWHITDRFDVQAGGRQSHSKQTYEQVTAGPFAADVPELDVKADAFTYLLTPRFRISPDLMIYARLASGYRPGTPNEPIAGLALPAKNDPDKTYNYEIGAKGKLAQDILSYDVSFYYIDWKNMQVTLVVPGTTIYANAGRAKSEGVEVALEARPLRGLSIAAHMSWSVAELTEGFPPSSSGYGVSGDRLPLSARFSGNLSAHQEFPLGNELTGYVGASLSYVGERLGIFQSDPTRQVLPPYAQGDVSGGVRFAEWNISLFVNNVTDRRGVLSGGVGTLIPTAFDVLQPRTFGAQLMWKF